MWSHYADQHRGVAFQLGCIDALDNRLLAAKRVEYTDKFIAFPSAEEYAHHLTGERPIDMVALVWKIAFTKHSDWAYEREWRVHIPLLHEKPELTLSLYDEPPEVFQALYLGCRMQRPEVQATVEVVRRCFPNMKIYRAKQSRMKYALDFELENGS